MSNLLIKASESTLVNHFEDSSVLLNLVTENYYSLNGVGKDMWEIIIRVGNFNEAFEALLTLYEVDHERLERDLQGFVKALADADLIIVETIGEIDTQ